MADSGMLPSSTRAGNFRYGNIDQNRLMSRLISHPLNSIQDDKTSTPQAPGGDHYRAYWNKQTPAEHKFEPLPVLKRYQKHNDPKEIQARNRQQLIEANKLRISSPESPIEKRAKLSLPPINSRISEMGKGSEVGSDWSSSVSVKRRQLDSREMLHGETDMTKVINYIRQAPDGFFLYLAHSYSRNDTRHSYYNLNYEQCGREYFTISNSGVSYYRPGEEVEFTPLENFAKEYYRYTRLVQIKVFTTFRMWKAFMVWYKNIRIKKVTHAAKALNDQLFLLQDALRPALLNIREMCFRISDMSLCKIEKKHTYTLNEFTDSQNQTLSQVTARLQEFRDLVKDVVASACRTRLFEAGFVPDDFLHPTDPTNDNLTGNGFPMPDSMDIDTLAQPPDKATYAEQANKRSHCRRLTNFIRLCDYLIVNTFHVLAVNSVQSLKNHFLEQLEATPSKDEIIGYVEDIKRKVDKTATAEGAEEPSAETKPAQPPAPGHPPPIPAIRPAEEDEAAKRHIPLFVTEMKLFIEAIQYHPDSITYQSGIYHVIQSFQETLLSIDNLIPDTTFDNFTRPYINEKYEEKICGDGPDLRSMFTADYHFQDLIKDCSDSLEAGFNAAKIYADTFDEFHRFYVENENTNVETLKIEPHDVEFFATSLAKYTREEKIAQLIDAKKPLGLLMIDSTNTKTKLEPSPRRILDVINEILPKIAKAKTDSLKSEAQDATVKLETKPETTLDFVDSLTFLDEIQERIDPLEQEAEVVRQMYELIDQYNVPCPPEDIVSHSSLTTTLNGCRNAMDKALTERDSNVTRFVSLLDKDIEILTQDVRQIKQDSQNPLLLDPTADKDKVKLLLDDYLKKIELQQRTSTQYRLYQKNFKVEVTKFDELEEVYGELKLKELLWNSLNEWDIMLEEYQTLNFDKLDHEQLTGIVNKYGKYVYQLERGLPPNQSLPILKEKVESLRAKLPTITNLRNPNLRPRHWDVIEDLIKFHRSAEEPLTLGKLIDINAFQHEERLQEISGQASSEASLEGILKRVEDMEMTVTMAPEIRGMLSPEGERVDLLKVKATGNVEDWLKQVEKNMITAVRTCIKKAKDDFEKSIREEWLIRHPHQSVLTVSQTFWCIALTQILTSDDSVRHANLEEFERKSYTDLNKLAALVRQELPQLVRDVCRALITIDVHARDIVSEMVQIENAGIGSFEWLKQLRYYFEQDLTVIRMANSQYIYGYEYLGASDRLVITPLTDRCYLCLMGALQLDLGGAPAGPAGTGKTETTKDLAKALAKQCVVFNCSDQVDYKMMGRFFSGLAQSGAWACFDEFNRINIEVLSVIAQQLITIRDAKAAKLSTFMFEGREIRLVSTCAVFITMNPGYAGRTELPDNLKALFRPQSMMVPDYRLIAEVILYSEGFENSKVLARKMVQMYKSCSEQLSQQDHYDFGMRAVKSVLVMAGVLKRESPNIDEDLVLIRALRDSNLPKFLTDDAILFKAIIQDLFPNVLLPEHDYGELRRTIIDVQTRRGLQTDESQLRKVIQFYETMLIRHGVMLVGPTLGGKTTVYRILAESLTDLHANGVQYHFYQPVHTYVLNPKSITAGELYGEFNKTTMEWKDGLMGSSVRQCVQDQSKDHHWIICDGPVDAVWIENLNTVLDDNKMLCLANSERIKYTPYMHMVFEVQDLACASPATVSRCGMVYIDSNDIRWGPYVKTWSRKFEEKFGELYTEYLLNLFNTHIDKGLTFIRKSCKEVIKQVDIAKVITLCCLIDSLLTVDNKIDLKLEEAKMKIMIATTFVFCYVWSVGGNIISKDWDQFDTFVRQQFDEDADAKLGQGGDLFSYEIDVHHRRMETWEKSVPTFKYDKTKPFFDLLVPNIDSCRFGYLLEKFVSVSKSVLFTGETGVGKTVIARAQLLKLAEEQNIVPLFLNFSAQTSSKRTQEMIVPKLEKRKKNAFGPPRGKRMIILIDDLNMPKLETYGAQPPIELLRQYQDFGGLYDRETLKWIDIQDVILCAACGPPGGGRNATTARLLRHFAIFAIPAPSEYSLKHIFKSILNGYLADFNQSTKTAGDSIIDAAVEIYSRMSAELLPTPTKSHYVFNLRDLSKCIQGILQIKPESVSDRDSLVRVFFHESMRVFHDRLINDDDKQYFHTMLSELSTRLFAIQIEPTTFVQKPIIFGDFMKVGAPKNERLYEEITDMNKIRNILLDYQEDYNLTNNKNTRLVFFMDAIEHIARIARIIRQDRGNALLVGVGGTGKQSLTRLASHICGYKCFQIELSRGYNYDSFHEDLKKLYEQTGPNNQNTVFLFTDNQIVVEEFLEDINNILNSGEVPNLFDKQDEREKMIIGCRPGAKEAGVAENDRDGIYTFFINRVRNNLHLVLCMSPVGSSFRTRCRMFPSLVNCCTIDWFSEWPREALLSVAHTSFEKYPWPKGEEFMVTALAKMCVEIHMSVSTKAKQLLSELRRYYYTTPTSYLELINLYLMMLNDKKKEIDNARARVERGLKKLEETNVLVDEMQLELVALEPQLKKKSDETAKLMETLAIDQEKADEVRRVVMEDEAVARVKAEETQAMKDDAQRDLNQALPAVEKANEAIGRLKKESIGEVRTFTKPPHMVEVVMQAVCIMFEKKKDWPSAKLLLGEPDLLNQIRNYPKDSIPESILRDLKPYLQMSNFNYKDILQSSVACASLAEWVIAMDMYAKISKEVEPKRKRVAAAEADLRAVTEQLKKKQQQLQQVEAKIKELQESYDHQVAEKKKLEISIMQTQSRLKRASKLTTALADEQIRWKENINEFNEQMKTVIGNVFVSSACVAYYGAFPSSYRQELVEQWVDGCKEHKIPVSDNPSIINVLADAFSIRQWVTQGLPRDDFSTENAILVTKGRRWPLIIDPQEQANRWIKNKEKENALKIIKMTDGHFLRILENCVRIGMPLLLEDIGETLDPALEPILLKQTFMSGGRLLIRLGDSDIEYDSNFKFYMTTKLSNPHYLPEICIKVTIINFSVTKQGLEDQILSDVVRLERPDLDEEMNRLIVTMNNDRNQLKAIEDKILKMLFESEGNILDNEELVNSLNDSKVTSSAIKRRLEETLKTEANISAAREKYRRAAKRGSLLYFVVADLGLIDPMYQFSLRYFTQLFNTTIENSTKSEDLNQRLQIILDSTTENIYTNVSRGLFEKDKLIFSFLLCAEILKLEGIINEVEWNFLLRGGLITEEKRPPKPSHDWLTTEHWNQALFLVGISDIFKNLPRDIEQYQQPIYVEINPELRISINNSDMTTSVPSEYNTKLSDFQKLLFVKAFAPYLLVQSITYFVAEQLGKKFVESPSVELPILYQDMSNRTALVFILSTGSDPMSSFTRFTAEMNMSTSYKAISLGQGQGPVAEDMISKSVVAGEWVFLQNCHLAASWMINMEAIVKNINEGVTPCHNNFRLFLSSMPANTFPVSVLQNSVKVTSEPPKGIRANMKRAFIDLTPTFFETHRLEMDWKKIVFGICFFHAALLERKKFGPLGFNIRYEFNDSDRECALLNFDMFCKEGAIPWDALVYITGEITYGGRVTDFWDQRCLRTILRRFFSPETLLPDYKYSPSGTYYCPERKFLQQYRDYIEELPLNDNPEIFGMNSNANITFQTQESNYLVNTIIDIQPRVSSGGAGKSNDEIVYELAEAILAKLPEKLDIEKAPRSLFEPDAKDRLNSLTTVLQQEVDRYNRLLNIIKLSLINQMKAIKGLVVMDETLEKMYTAFLNNQVPAIWTDAAYPSLKSLASWIKDLLLRCDFMGLWITHGLPKSYWLPGLFFPQGFLTGVLQVHARKYDLPIDELSFHFTILPFERDHPSYNEQAKRLEYGKKLDVDEQLPHVNDGVILHGLYMEAFRWDNERKQIADAARGEMIATLPMLHMEPRQNYVVDPTQYISPLYKTAARAGVLSTTGHSTNFVVTVNLPTDKPQDYWISMGSALLCQVSD
ncbi:unnamed protein product [Rotaria sp. Silwood2]|nr:unnamed protein product [Rotaria sp. Silwood2]